MVLSDVSKLCCAGEDVLRPSNPTRSTPHPPVRPTCIVTLRLRCCLQAAEDGLVAAMEAQLTIAKPGSRLDPLRGLPLPQGRHMRFTDTGKAVESPGSRRTILRGVAPAAGSHKRFD